MILVTGASGLIGYEVCQLLDNMSAEFCFITNRNRVAFNGKRIESDLRSIESIKSISSLFKGGTIIHCAAMIPSASSQDESAIKAHNKAIDRNIVELAVETKSRIIYLSSTSVYGKSINLPINETMVAGLADLSPYSEGKIQSESLMLSTDPRNIILRINAPYGVRQRNKTVLSIFIENALKHADLSFHGSGCRSQDFTHCIDIAQLIVKCIKSSASGIFNVSFGQPISMRELAGLIKASLPESRSLVVPSGIPDQQEGYRALFDTSKAKTHLSWSPQISLAEGINQWIALARP